MIQPISQLRVISKIKSPPGMEHVDEEKGNCAIPTFAIIYVIKTFTRFWSTITLLRSLIRICLFESSSATRLFLPF